MTQHNDNQQDPRDTLKDIVLKLVHTFIELPSTEDFDFMDAAVVLTDCVKILILGRGDIADSVWLEACINALQEAKDDLIWEGTPDDAG